MARPLHVVIQDKKDFDREEAQKGLFVLIVLGLFFLAIIGYFLYTSFISPLIDIWNETSPLKKVITILVLGGIIFGIIGFFRGLKNNIFRKREKERKKGFFDFIDLNDNLFAWTLIFGFAGWFISQYTKIDFISQLNPFILLIIAGLVISLFRWFMLVVLYGNRFIIDTWFLVWSFKSSIIYSLIILLFGYIGLSQGFIYFVLFGFLFHFFSLLVRMKLTKEFKNKTLGRTFLLFIMLVIIYGLSLI